MADFFSHILEATPDPIFGLTAAFAADPRKQKINLSIGVYKDETQTPPILHCVKEAERRLLAEETTKNYLPIEGDLAFINASVRLLLGERYDKQTCHAVQTIGGTGALRLAADFLKQVFPSPLIHIPDPSWPNHKGIFAHCGVHVLSYPYYDYQEKNVAFLKVKEALLQAPENSAVLLHVNCHNPSGSDLTLHQWEEIGDLCFQRRLLPILDAAYLGFVEELEKDVFPIRLFARKGIDFFVTVSYSKNLSLYGERVGLLLIVSSTQTLLSQLKVLIRRNYSNPPLHGARIVATILQDPSLVAQWSIELEGMRKRMQKMRTLFVQALGQRSTQKNYEYLLHKNGMFSFCDLRPEQVELLRKDHAIYVTSDGRMNLVGLSEETIPFVADSIVKIGG